MLAPVPDVSTVKTPDWSSQSPSPVSAQAASGQAGSADDKHAFAAMMDGPASPTAHRAAAAGHGGPASLIERMASSQHAQMQDFMTSTRDLAKAAPHLPMVEVISLSQELGMKSAMVSAQFQVASNVNKNIGKGVDTLMRNQ